jgi:hypothetical protein
MRTASAARHLREIVEFAEFIGIRFGGEQVRLYMKQ